MASGEIDVTPGRIFSEEELVDNAKLNEMATPTLRVKPLTITARELADGAINADKLDVDLEAQLGVADGSVTTSKLASNAVTSAKMAENARIPTGTLLDFAGPTPPDGWLLCHGQLVSRATYATLFAVIGTSWGVGDGTTTFGIPDLRGYVCAGKDDMGGAASGRLTGTYITGGGGPTALGGFGGAQSHMLIENEMPSHAHTTQTPNHAHNLPMRSAADEGASSYGLQAGGAASGRPLLSYGGYAGYVTDTQGLSCATDYRGANFAHRNVQPTRIINKMIRYL